jgi:hypothetical protein
MANLVYSSGMREVSGPFEPCQLKRINDLIPKHRRVVEVSIRDPTGWVQFGIVRYRSGVMN